MIRALCLAGCLAAGGCAHHQANPYAYAPPLAPPVYPQPQSSAQPVALPASPGPAATMPAMATPGVVGPPMAAAPAMPVMTASGEIAALPDGSCPPCAAQAGGMPVAYETAVQTTPCP